MMGTFNRNAKHLHGHNVMFRLMAQLGMHDYVVHETHTGKGEKSSVRIDRRLQIDGEDLPEQITNHGGKLFGSTEYCGCRVYWAIPDGGQELTPEAAA